MPLPKPRKNETQDEFMARCMHEAYGANAPSDRTQEQAVAMCMTAWRDRKPSDDGKAILNRAYSLLTMKQVDEEARILTGMATTPTPDRLEDVVVPEGAQFKLPMPLLWQHDSKQPIGQVTHAKVSKAGIEIVAKIAKGVTAEIDRAWSLIKAGLVTGLSIGFKPIEFEWIEETKGMRFIKWDFLELSAVTIPANSECTIATVKSIDAAQRAALGHSKSRSVVHLNPPGASGQTQRKFTQEGKDMKTIAEQITALEAKRAASAARMEAVMQKTLDEDRTSDAAEQEEFDQLSGEVDALDKDLVRLRKIENAKALAARPITKATTVQEGAAIRASIVVRQPELPPGIEGIRALKCTLVAKMDGRNIADVAAEMYGTDSNVYAAVTKANVPAGTTISGNWAANLVGMETGLFADFVAYLRPLTILGRFGTGGIPALRAVPFYVPLITQTGAGAGYWVGEGKAKPVTSFNFTRTHLSPLKVASICVLTMENIRFSNPKSDTIVRDQLAEALSGRLDIDFITPSKAAVAGVSPASITNGAPAIASATGTDADSVRLDVRSLYAKFTAANNPPSTGVWIMPTNVAVSLASMVNPLGQQSFPDMNIAGGRLFGMPVIASDYTPATNVILVNASDVYLGDDGQFTVDASEEASLEMSDAPTGDSGAPTATSLVSMFQTNSVAIRAERVISWARRRTQSVAYLTGVDWGGPVNTV
jgi:HK97 family phage prohead protease